jgi:hypothetical protein
MSLKKHKGITIYLYLEKVFGQTKVLSVRQELKVCLTECQAHFSAVSRSLWLKEVHLNVQYHIDFPN